MERTKELLKDCPVRDRELWLGRFAVLNELGFFGDETNIKLAKEKHPPGTFIGSIRQRFSNTYGNLDGCSKGEIEVAMELTETMDIIYDAELRDGTPKH